MKTLAKIMTRGATGFAFWATTLAIYSTARNQTEEEFQKEVDLIRSDKASRVLYVGSAAASFILGAFLIK